MISQRRGSSTPPYLLVCTILVCAILTLATLTAPAVAGTCQALGGGPLDGDRDGFVAAGDCNDADPLVWSAPGAVGSLAFADDQTLVWGAPLDPGGVLVRYDTLRSDDPSDFLGVGAQCLDPDASDLLTVDTDVPVPGQLFSYLVRARNDCGDGSLGLDSQGVPRSGVSCDCALLCDDANTCTRDFCSNGTCDTEIVEPLVLESPESVAVCDGDQAHFRVYAEGTGPLSYQWFRNGAPVGIDSPELTLGGLTAADDGSQIFCEVTDGCATTASQAATLTVFATVASCQGGLDISPVATGASRPPGDANPGSLPVRVNAGHVDLHSGGFRYQEVDLRIPGRGFDFVWARTYSSRANFDHGHGFNWDYNHAVEVRESAANPADREVRDGRGRDDLYLPSGPDTWTADSQFRVLRLELDGRYTLTFPSRTVWTFHALDGLPWEGKIREMSDRNGNTMGFDYDGAGRLVTIHDTLDTGAHTRDIAIAYDAGGRIASVTDWTGRAVTYDYYQPGERGGTQGDLKSVTTPAVTGTPTGNDFPAGRTTVYTYTEDFFEPALNHNLLTIADPHGRVYLQNVYTTAQSPALARFDRLDRQIFPDGVVSYVYVPLAPDPGNNFASSKTIVNDRMGNVVEWFYDVDARMVLEHRYTGRAADAGLPTDDVQNRPGGPVRGTDPPLFETRYEWNIDGLLTKIDRPEGDSVQFTYDSANPDIKKRANPLQLLRTPGPRGGDQVQILETWAYNGNLDQDALLECVYDLEAAAADLADAPGPRTPPCEGVCNDHGSCLGSSSSTDGACRCHEGWTDYTDGRGNSYVRDLDPQGNATRLERPLVLTGVLGGGSQLVEDFRVYNGFGQVTQRTDGEGRITDYTYHAAGPQAGHLKDIIVDPPGLGLTTTYEYDSIGRRIRVIDPRGNDSLYDYNALDEPVRVTARPPFLYEIDLYWDTAGRPFTLEEDNADENGTTRPNADLARVVDRDLLGRIVRITEEVDDTSCVVTEYEYDANGNVTRLHHGEATNGNQPDNTVRSLYDERDLLFQAIRAEGTADASTTQLDYDGNRNVVRLATGLEGPSGPYETVYVYDGFDRRVRTIDPMGNEEDVHYDANDNVTSVRLDGELDQGAGGGLVRHTELTLTFDEIDRLVVRDEDHFDTATGAPIGDGLSTTRFFWDESSRLIRVEDDNGQGTDRTYDDAGRLESIIDPKANSVTYGYDPNSNIVIVTEVDKSDLLAPDETFVTQYAYDNMDRRIRVTNNAGDFVRSHYDSRHNEVRVDDRKGNEVIYVHDGLDRRIRAEATLTDTGDGTGSPTGSIILRQFWDDSSRLTAREDDSGYRTEYTYDPLDRLIRELQPDQTQVDYLHDAHDNVIQRTDAAGTSSSYAYDGLGRLTGATVVPGPGVSGTTFESYHYDALSRVVRAEDDDTLVTRSHDSLSGITEEKLTVTGTPTATTTAGYDGAGNRLTMTYPSGLVLTNAYDPLNRVTNQSDGIGTIATFSYIGPYRPERIDHGNNTRVEYFYDTVRRITRVDHILDPTGAAIPLERRTYVWDANDNKKSFIDVLSGDTTTYTYDSMDRLIRRDYLPMAGPPETTDYDLDDRGNRENVTGGPSPGAYTRDATLPDPADDQMSQYTTTPFDVRLHDLNGNLATLDDLLPSQVDLEYDFRDQLVRVVDSGAGLTTTHVYDAFGRRAETTVDDGILPETRGYVPGIQVVPNPNVVSSGALTVGAGVPSVPIEVRDGAGAALAVHILAHGQVRSIQEKQDLNGNVTLDEYFLHPDDLGTTLRVTDAFGNTAETYSYGDYGSPEFTTGGGVPIPGSEIGNVVLFQGLSFHEETGLYLVGARHMDPAAGRYISRRPGGTWTDPGDLGNGLSFAGNNPTSFGGGGGRGSLASGGAGGGLLLGGGPRSVTTASVSGSAATVAVSGLGRSSGSGGGGGGSGSAGPAPADLVGPIQATPSLTMPASLAARLDAAWAAMAPVDPSVLLQDPDRKADPFEFVAPADLLPRSYEFLAEGSELSPGLDLYDLTPVSGFDLPTVIGAGTPLMRGRLEPLTPPGGDRGCLPHPGGGLIGPCGGRPAGPPGPVGPPATTPPKAGTPTPTSGGFWVNEGNGTRSWVPRGGGGRIPE